MPESGFAFLLERERNKTPPDVSASLIFNESNNPSPPGDLREPNRVRLLGDRETSEPADGEMVGSCQSSGPT